MSTQNSMICKVCGSDSFTHGEVGFGYANVKPKGKLFSDGSPLLLTFCKECGEVASIKVKNTKKF